MICSKFSLQNYRCFKEKQEVKIAVPDNENCGSGLTYIVGENNSGKTSLLEAMQFTNGATLKTREANGNMETFFKYYDSNGREIHKLSPVRLGSHTLRSTIGGISVVSPHFIPSRRYWSPRADRSANQLSSQSQHAMMRPNEQYNSGLYVSNMLKSIELDDDKYNYFINSIKEIIPNFTGYTIENQDYEYVAYKIGNDTHRIDFAGDGVLSIMCIVALIVSETQNPIIIDEPELSLHPLAKKNLCKYLGKISKDKQVIIATHDPYFVSWEYFENGAVVNRLSKDGESNKTSICTLKDYNEYRSIIVENWQKPYMMDLVAKEIFFCDNILLLEGQEDVGLLKKYLSDCNINIFGYGIGGFSNAKITFALLKDLGIKKVAVIIDGGEQENILVQELGRNYANYKILQWNKNDIRDKYRDNDENDEQIKNGYFDVHGNLKNESELDDFWAKINEIRRYFE